MAPELRRIPIDSADAGRDATVEGEWARYLARVLRCRPGDRVWGFSGDGCDYLYELASVSPSLVQMTYVEHRRVETDPLRELALLVGLPKAGKLEAMIEAATALGATRILSFAAMRSEGKGGKRERWEKAALEAARQCGRTTVPTIQPPASSLTEALSQLSAALPHAAGAVGEPSASLSLVEWAAAQPAETPRAWLVGPEGHLTPDELSSARAAGFTAVNLGPRILRAELAAVVGLAELALR